jgi:hypothetical protein
MGRKDILRWAAKKHSEDPDNFLKNIGFTKWARSAWPLPKIWAKP